MEDLALELGFSENFDMRILRNRIVGLMERMENSSDELTRYENMAHGMIKSADSQDPIAPVKARVGLMVMGLTMYLDAAAGTKSVFARERIQATLKILLRQTLDQSLKCGLVDFERMLIELTSIAK